MFRTKHVMTLVLALLFIFSGSLTSAVKRDSALDSNFSALYAKLKSEGALKVIVKIDVPGIEGLTTKCNYFKTGSEDLAAIQASVDADLELETAINHVTQSVLYQLNGTGYKLNHTYSTLPFIALEVTPQALRRLENATEVISVMEDRLLPLPKDVLAETDLDDPKLYDSTDIVGADIAWNLGFTGAGWYVAVLDSGILRTHEMFAGKTVVEQCYSAELSCPNGRPQMSGPGSAAIYSSYYAGHEHGTHVAGIAAGNSHGGRAGVAKNANIIAVQVFSKFPKSICQNYGYDSGCVLSYDSDQVKGLEFVYSKRNQYKIASVNLSLGGSNYGNEEACNSDSLPYKTALQNLRDVGIAPVVASGNDGECGRIGSPSCMTPAVSVGATDKNNNEAYYSNFQVDMLDILAPGSAIVSAGGSSNTAYVGKSGTSMATPHVAGAWAIIKQFSNLDVQSIKLILQDSPTSVVTKCGTGAEKPLLNVGVSLQKLLKVAPPENFSGEQVENYSYFQTEYINILTWTTNDLNKDRKVIGYRIYEVGETLNDLSQLSDMNKDTFTYYHRRVKKNIPVTYAITAYTEDGDESIPSYFELEMGIAQGN